MEFLWDNLVCQCNSVSFVQSIELRWKKGSGTTTKPTGKYVCVKCGEEQDVMAMIRAKELKNAEREVEAIRAAHA